MSIPISTLSLLWLPKKAVNGDQTTVQQLGAKLLDSCGYRRSRNLQLLGKPYKSLHKGKYLSESIISLKQGSRRHNCILWGVQSYRCVLGIVWKCLEVDWAYLSPPGNRVSFFIIRILNFGDNMFFWTWFFFICLISINPKFLVWFKKSSSSSVNSNFLN